ncbi:MAG: sterol desaturase family protein [Myxococcales bacterium]|nr:sterol desaturase family protein [Myxococcales bacterium]
MTSLVVTFALGACSWTLLEYVIHRWLGHDRRFRGNPFGVEHVRHHAEGNYFAPTVKKLMVAVVVALGVGGPATLLAGAHGAAAVGGLLVMYGAYEVLHRREHTHPGIGRYGRWARRHHFHHHFVDPRTNHGVTTPLWDLVFGTYRTPEVIPVPEKLCMRWLLDDAGSVRREHADRYTLRPARA